jgi:thiol-disulfide isomerase/thioredoxin
MSGGGESAQPQGSRSNNARRFEMSDKVGAAPHDTGPRRQRVFWLVMAGVAAVVLLQLVVNPVGPPGSDGTAHPAVGGRLISLHVEPLTGGGDDVYLEQLEGDVTVVNFWGTWCPPCRQEFPHIVALYEKYGDRADFRLLPISDPGGSQLDVVELRSETAAFLGAQHTTLPTYFDPQQSLIGATQIAIGNNSFGFPTTLVLDRDTTIRGVWEGYAPGMERDIEALVEELLDESPASPDEPSAETTRPQGCTPVRA